MAGDGTTSAASAPRDLALRGHGIRLHALDWGGPADGQVILLLHGVGGNAWVWHDVALRLRRLLPDHRVVGLDQREGGDTEHPPTGYSREAFAGDVTAAAEELGGGPVVLVGHSRGGWLAAWIAATRPDVVDRLVLVDPARLVFASTADSDVFFEWVRDSLGPFDSEESAVAWARGKDRQARWTSTRRRSFLFGLRRNEEGQLVGKLPVEVVPQLQEARRGGEAVTEALARISAPTLLFVAERQTPERRKDKLEYGRLIPGVRTVLVGGSHFLHTDRPAVIAREIARFVAP
jgi:pimeloyl-ACP methyl ester carboxylesterase